MLVIKLTKYFGKKNVLEGFYLTVLRTFCTYIYSHVMLINFVFFNILNKRLFYKEIFYLTLSCLEQISLSFGQSEAEVYTDAK